MGRDDSKDAVLYRTDGIWRSVHQALKNGISTAVELHDHVGWDYRDDTHLYQHMIRRTALPAIKSLKLELAPEFEGEDESLSMSGLILSLEEDVVRMWHISTVDIQTPSTRTRRTFTKQPPCRQQSILDVRDTHDVHDVLTQFRRQPDLNKLILRWTVVDHHISRFDLVRPTGIWKGHVDVDWSDDLLKRYQLH
jgi:hypothetical protein